MALSNKGNFIINSTEFSPASLRVDFESIATEDSGRAISGKMNITWIYNRVRKIEIKMPPLNASEVSAILSLVQGKIYNITYFDPLSNQEETKTVYTSNSSADCYSGVLYNGLYQGVAFNAIEQGGERD